jgi:thiol:disulfide interchange protein
MTNSTYARYSEHRNEKAIFTTMKRIILTAVLWVAALVGSAQIIEPIQWTFNMEQDGKKVHLHYKASIDKGWHLYDTSLPEGGPIPTQVVYQDTTLFDFVGELQKSQEPEIHYDPAFAMDVRYFTLNVVFTQTIELKSDDPVTIEGYVLFMGCNDETCLPPNEADFSFEFNTPSGSSTQEGVPFAGTRGSTTGQTIWLFLLISLLAGFASILTPCVFPMIPMTVSFFMQNQESRKKAIATAFFFGLSILAIFTLLGALFSLGVFGPNVGSVLSTHWIPNLIFFIVFVVFAISFFGAFEMVLPASLVNKTDSKADKGGLAGAFFMALTTVIVSFSCTGPFIGALIIEAVQDGGIRPMLGMFFYGLAFATPFTLLAIFPSALKKLPKSGGWLNAVKVVFAFILLAFGFKFLSNIDQVYGLGMLTREIYLAIWIVLFFMLGLYLLGKIKFLHDTEMPHLGIGRFLFSVAVFVFTVYLFSGLLGAPLTAVSTLIPPAGNESYTVGTTPRDPGISSGELCGPARYAETLHMPHALTGYFDFAQGMACANEQGKPAFIVFKGHACANCKKMENTVWADPETLKLLADHFVLIALYTDDRTKLPQEEWITSSVDGKVKKNLGKINLDLLIKRYQTNSIPFHVIIRPDGTEYTLGVTFDEEEFREFIKLGL